MAKDIEGLDEIQKANVEKIANKLYEVLRKLFLRNSNIGAPHLDIAFDITKGKFFGTRPELAEVNKHLYNMANLERIANELYEVLKSEELPNPNIERAHLDIAFKMAEKKLADYERAHYTPYSLRFECPLYLQGP